MASGHVNRIKRPDTWLHRPMLQNVKKILANPEPSTHGHFSDIEAQPTNVRFEERSRSTVQPLLSVSVADHATGNCLRRSSPHHRPTASISNPNSFLSVFATASRGQCRHHEPFPALGGQWPTSSITSDWRMAAVGAKLTFASWRNRCRIDISLPSGVPQVTGHAADDMTQPCVRWLIVEPSQPNHGSFDRLRRT